MVLALSAGANGIVCKPFAVATIFRYLAHMIGGGTVLCPKAQQQLMRGASNIGPAVTRSLTRRETEILHYLAMEFSNKEVAEHLKIEPSTVHTTSSLSTASWSSTIAVKRPPSFGGS